MKKKVFTGITAVTAVAAVAAIVSVIALGMQAVKKENRMKREIVDFHNEALGENVYIFSPEDNPKVVQQVLDDIYTVQETNQFGTDRYAIFFMPGEYDASIQVQVGYYEMVAGLGISPLDTKIHHLQTMARWLGSDPKNHNATCNFWRGVENLTIDSDTIWAVSQATDMRRVQINGNLLLHDAYGWASGGFLSDSNITGVVDSGSQQQWLSRNNNWKQWTGENWNLVFVGEEEGSVPEGRWPEHPYTEVKTTDIVREKPFLVFDEKHGFGVYVPGIRRESMGISWRDDTESDFTESKENLQANWVDKLSDDSESDEIISLDHFYIAHAAVDTAETINAAIEEGKHLLFTPGIYKLEVPIEITAENTIVLGLGLATLESAAGNPCMTVADASGIVIAGILFDAGVHQSESLMIVGEVEHSASEKTVPIQLSDLYFRVGGTAYAEFASTQNCLTINADNVAGDNFWIWRADHGDCDIKWDSNTAQNGLTVNGDDVTIYALMVEHFEEYQTIWNGNGGRIYMYQSEIPYDVPEQKRWMSHEGTRPGYASIYVDDAVEDFYATGLGVYLYNRDHLIRLESAMEIPDKVGVKVENICTVMLTGYPGMMYVVNDVGEAVLNAGERSVILNYENGVYEE